MFSGCKHAAVAGGSLSCKREEEMCGLYSPGTGVREGQQHKKKRSPVLGVQAEVREEIQERPHYTGCEGIWGCMAARGGSRADAQQAGVPGRSLPSCCPASSNLQDTIVLPARIYGEALVAAAAQDEEGSKS